MVVILKLFCYLCTLHLLLPTSSQQTIISFILNFECQTLVCFGLILLYTKFKPSTMSGTGQKVYCGVGWVVGGGGCLKQL